MPTIPIRFVCVSDTFGETPDLPTGDVLVHAGNLTRNGSVEELARSVSWIDRTDFKVKLVIAGDRDACLDANSTWHECHRHRHSCPLPLETPSSIIYLCHEGQMIQFRTSSHIPVRFKVFGSPFSHRRGGSPFGYETEEAASDLWSNIPLDSDIVVTHIPPQFHCDRSPSRGFSGCRSLREALWRVRPRLVVCGHECSGRGVEVVK